MSFIRVNVFKSKGKGPKAVRPIKDDGSSSTEPSRAKSRLGLFLLLAFVAVAVAVYFYQQKPARPYATVAPQTTNAVFYFDEPAFKQIVGAMQENRFAWWPLKSFNEEIKQFFSSQSLGSIEEWLLVFKGQGAWFLLPVQENSQVLAWLGIAEIKLNAERFDQVILEKEKIIKQNYNLTTENYRQIRIGQGRKLDKSSSAIYYARIGDLFFISNDLGTLKKSVNRAID